MTITLEIVTAQGIKHIGPIKVNRGIMQGDDFSVLLYAISVDSISCAIRSSEGYRLTHEKNDKVTQVLHKIRTKISNGNPNISQHVR